MSYSPWARRRKTLYALGLVLILLGISIPVFIIWIHEPATCFDGKQNQGETGVDMGGPCPRLDPRFLDKPQVLWVRPLRLRAGYYNAVAYIENSNPNAGARQVSYRMKFYDENGVLVAKRVGKTDIYPSMIFPVFEGAIDSGKRELSRATFELLEEPKWYRYDSSPMKGLKISGQKLSKTRHSLRLTAKVKNTDIDDKSDIHFVATLFDEKGTAIAVSHTYIAYITAASSAEITFTWPNTLSSKPASVDIIPLIPLE